ncbi:aquaporin Z [Persicobacter diffluens]|uniref:Aquaporin Z n=1 Tax=Persicobacter diffluens TaxID=981 RepID=A0AAN4VV36_9BACT|nr:aquaporin Z [Persicobacter diffluens]
MEVKATTKYFAEFIGTMVLVLVGCGSAVFAGGHIGFMGVSFAFGLSVLTMVYTIGPISGCHINPAISISMTVAGKLSTQDALGYIVSQCLGAAVGAGIIYFIANGNPDYDISANGLAANGYGTGSPDGYSMIAGLVAEIVFTALFLLVIFGATSEQAPEGFAGIAIGLALVMIHLVTIPVTNTSVNPARSLGPALFVGGDALSQLWLFWVGPIIGGIIAAIIWKSLFSK